MNKAAQKLILPINQAKLTASIDTAAYRSRFGYAHCGSDLVSSDGKTTVYASGNGTVAAAGYDNACGNVVAVVYENAVNRRTGLIAHLCLRYFHLASINVKVGQKVTKDTVLGQYGMTGKYAGTGPHLHVEADLDVVYVLYTPTVTSSNYLRGTGQGAYAYTSVKNTVRNPIDWLYCKTSGPDNQTWSTAGDSFIRGEDKVISEFA